MSLLLRRLGKLFHGQPAAAVVKRSSLLISYNSYSSSSLLQTPPCFVLTVSPCGEDLGKLVIVNANEFCITDLEKKVPLDLVDTDHLVGERVKNRDENITFIISQFLPFYIVHQHA